jgi:hypothetical protein
MDPGFDWRDRIAFIKMYYPERKQGLHDPLGTCSTCRDYRRTDPARR